MLYLYGLLPLDARVAPPEHGVLGVAVSAVAGDGVQAWVSELSDEFSVDANAVAAHLQVLQSALTAGVTPLPARVGQSFRTADDLHRAVGDQRLAITEALKRVAGCCEMVVVLRSVAVQEDSPPPARTPGRGYLEGLQRREVAVTRLAKRMANLRDTFRAELGGLILAVETGVPLTEPRPTITLAHLVSIGTVSEYRRRLGETLERSIERDEWSWGIQGPIPPFSFARWESSAGAQRD